MSWKFGLAVAAVFILSFGAFSPKIKPAPDPCEAEEHRYIALRDATDARMVNAKIDWDVCRKSVIVDDRGWTK